jgi:ATP-binding cassette subfamily B protein
MIPKEKTRHAVAVSLRLIRAFRAEIAQERWLISISGVTVLGAVLFRTLEPWPLKFVYNSIFPAKNHVLPLAVLHGLSPQAQVAFFTVSMIAMTGLAATFEYLSTISMGTAASRILARVRRKLFQHLENLPVSFHSRNKTGDLITHVTYDIDRMRDVTVNAILPFFTNIFTLSAMVVAMFWMNWRLGWVVVVAFPVFFLVVYRITGRIKQKARVQRSQEAAVAATAAETIASIRIVQALSLQEKFLEVFSAANIRSLDAGNQVLQFAAGLERTVDLLATVTMAIVLWLGVRIVLDNRLTAGDLIVFANYLRTSFKPIRQLAKYLGQMAGALASGDHVLELLGTCGEIQDAPHAVPAQAFAGHICFENVSFSYEPGRPTLRNIRFEVKPGQKVVLVGPSGSGKSTIASLLLRFHDPREGRIFIDGSDIRHYTIESLRSQISIVMQDSPLFALTVRDNIACGAAGASSENVLLAARIANAHNFIQHMPQQYETPVGERGSTLSGGQRQRIAIARAAIRRAPIIILDEPATGLDRKNEREVTAALDRLSVGRTTLLITHDLHAAQDADLILFISEGRIAERGTHKGLMALNGEYAAMFLRQAVRSSYQEDICAVNA